MKNQACSTFFITFIFFLLFLTIISSANAQTCKASGRIRGGKKDKCNQQNDSEYCKCCVKGKFYPVFKCSPPVGRRRTKATLTIKSFQKGGNGGGPSECDGKFHSDNTPVVALSTGWYGNGKRCKRFITIQGNGRIVRAKVVDECDSTMGCDAKHDFQPPCRNNIVVASKAVWKALGVSKNDRGEMEIVWSDA